MSSLVKFVEEQFVETKDHPSFSSGDTITVYYEIREGDKKGTQFGCDDDCCETKCSDFKKNK